MLRKSSLAKVAVLTMGVLVVASTIAEAQGRRGRGGRGGFGDPFGQLNNNEYLQKELNLTSAQKKRMEEISLQMRGTRALTDDSVVKALGISDTQKEAIEKARRSAFEDLRGLFGRRGRNQGNDAKRPSRDEIRKKIESARTKSDEAVMKVLTSSQRSKWKSMLGKPIDREKLQQRRGGRDGSRNRPRRKKRPDV